MDELTKKRIQDAALIWKKIEDDGFDKHHALIAEALEWFLLDCLEELDFERLKKQMFETSKKRIYLEH